MAQRQPHVPHPPSHHPHIFPLEPLRLLNALNSEDRGLKVHFSLATMLFETFELILCQMLSSQGKNAPSNPCPHYLVRLAASRTSFDASFGYHLAAFWPEKWRNDGQTIAEWYAKWAMGERGNWNEGEVEVSSVPWTFIAIIDGRPTFGQTAWFPWKMLPWVLRLLCLSLRHSSHLHHSYRHLPGQCRTESAQQGTVSRRCTWTV